MQNQAHRVFVSQGVFVLPSVAIVTSFQTDIRNVFSLRCLVASATPVFDAVG